MPLVVYVGLLLLALAINGLRWLRVGQREHYLAGSVSRFFCRWLRLDLQYGIAAAVIALAVATSGLDNPNVAILVMAVFIVGPGGLSFTGETSKLEWTTRLKKVGAVTLALAALVSLITAAMGGRVLFGLSISVIAIPVIIDVALLLLAPLETRSQKRWIDKARAKMALSAPQVVAITGSYGKTTTKEYARRILSAEAPTLASPASFNNAMGLARTVNEQLAPGTKWFIAEMGTYGPGEIATLCSWIPPHIAAITAIGPVHLERFKSLDVTLRSKAEIAEKASVVVLNVDDPMLASLANELTEAGKTVVRCSALDPSVDAAVIAIEGGWKAFVSAKPIGELPDLPFGSNLAVAIGIGVAAGMAMPNLQEVFADASTPDHRQSVVKGAGGAWIVDDTFNSNPAGAASALTKLLSLPAKRRVVVTPGMVELGKQQRSANRGFAESAADVVDDFIVVKKTNKRALLAGARNGTATVRVMKTREDAVAWVRSNLGEGDAVLYENDLPDHYA